MLKQFNPFLEALKTTYLVDSPICTINRNYQKVLMEMQKKTKNKPENIKINLVDGVSGSYPESRNIRLSL
jgi:hypothetical protein